MKILFNKEELNKALHILQKAAQNKVNSNIPGSIYIKTLDNAVEMQANDYDIGIKLTIPAEIVEPGIIVIASKYFLEMVKKMPTETITLEQISDQQSVKISSGTTEYMMVTYDEEDFALVEPIRNENEITIDTSDLKNLIDLTIYAVSSDESRQIFTGTLLEIKNDEISMVGTDTHRLAVKKIVLDSSLQLDESAVIPARALNELSRLLPVDQPQMITIVWNKSQIAFQFDNVFMLSRLVEGKFPDYNKIIPQQFYATAVLNRRELMSALERVSLLSKDFNYNAIKFEWSEKEVILTSQNIDVGTAKENLPCEFKGSEFTISFNGKYIMDVLKHGTSDLVYFNLTDRGPVVVRLDDNPNYTYVATPIRTN